VLVQFAEISLEHKLPFLSKLRTARYQYDFGITRWIFHTSMRKELLLEVRKGKMTTSDLTPSPAALVVIVESQRLAHLTLNEGNFTTSSINRTDCNRVIWKHDLIRFAWVGDLELGPTVSRCLHFLLVDRPENVGFTLGANPESDWVSILSVLV